MPLIGKVLLVLILFIFCLFTLPFQNNVYATCDIITRIEPQRPNINQSVKVVLNNHTGNHYIDLYDPNGELESSFLIGSQDKEVTLGTVSSTGSWKIQVSHMTNIKTKCSNSTNFNVTGSSLAQAEDNTPDSTFTPPDIPACSGNKLDRESDKPVEIGKSSPNQCPKDTCYIEDTHDTGSTYRCYKLQKSADVAGTCEIDKNQTLEASGIPIFKTNNCKAPYHPAWKGGFECACVSEGNPNILDKKMCCTRSDYSDNNCPAGTDTSKQCCKLLSNGEYDRIDKVACLQSGTVTAAPPPCSPERQKAGECSSGGGTVCNTQNGQPLDARKKPVNGREVTYYTQKDSEAEVAITKNNVGILTAVGCVPTEPQALVNGFVRYGSLAMGGVALLMMIWASLRYITSLGSAEAINQARDQFFAALIGLLFIIMSVLLLQIIGYDILGIPGFGKAV
jgi:hypothetical protein